MIDASGSGAAPAASVAHRTDPVTTEVIRHGLVASAEQMKIALRRTAFSPIIYEMADLAAALYDCEMRLLAQASALPLFLGALDSALRSMVQTSGGVNELAPGDVIFSTYGYEIGSHQQDATVVLPEFVDGELLGYAVVKAHHLDIGAKEVYCTDTVDIYQEGTIFPSVKIYRGGKRQEDMLRTVLANSRLPSALLGDLNAQIFAGKTGNAAFSRLCLRHTRPVFDAAVDDMFDHGERVIRGAIARIPDGRYTGHGLMDNNGLDDVEIPFSVTVEITGSDVLVDFTDSPPEQKGPMNCPRASTIAAAHMAIMSIASGGEFANHGHFRPIAVKTRPGTMFDPRPPAPIFMYGWPEAQAVDVIHRALGEAVPGLAPAGSGGDFCGVLWWGHQDGELWSDGADHCSGHGATRGSDAGAPLMTILDSGVRSASVEVWEARRPVLIERFELATDSAGAGRWRGGCGVSVHYRAREDCYLTLAVERLKLAPWGLHGGGDGRPNRYRMRHVDGTVTELGKVTGIMLPAGATLEVETGGGGGFGLASERAADEVLSDVADGYYSPETARRLFPQAFVPDT